MPSQRFREADPTVDPGGAEEDGRADGRLEVLVPLSNELIETVLRGHGWASFTDEGDVGGYWGENLIYFYRTGDAGTLLQIQIRTSPEFAASDAARLREFCNTWNHDWIWPKAYVHVERERAWVVGEVVADLRHGVTRDQLDQLVMCGVGSGCQLATAAATLCG